MDPGNAFHCADMFSDRLIPIQDFAGSQCIPDLLFDMASKLDYPHHTGKILLLMCGANYP
jgi:hypothetical protein